MKRKFTWSIVFILFLNGIPGIFIPQVQAALPPGEYVISDILAHDTNIHPETRDEVWYYVTEYLNGRDIPGRTGWSAYTLVCTAKDDGTGNYWKKGDEARTSDSGRDKRYPVAEYHSEIIAQLTPKYGGAKAEEIYQAALATGKSLVYQDGSKTDSVTEKHYEWYPCNVGERGGYYNNADFKLTLTFTAGETIPPGGGDGGGGGGTCSFTIGSPSNGGSVIQNVTNASPSGSITSDNGIFDVVQGIPSSEYLRVQAQSQEYLVDQNFMQKRGKISYSLTVTKEFTLKWEEEEKSKDKDGKEVIKKIPKSETETKEASVQIERPYSFWQIERYTVHKLNSATFTNYALPGVTVVPSNANVSASGSHSPDINQHVFPAECATVELPSETITGGKTKPSAPDISSEAKSKADSAIGPPNVKNDRADFKSSPVMNDALTKSDGPTPSQVPYPPYSSMQQGNLLISPTKTNYYRAPSTGSVDYGVLVNINGSGGSKTFPFSVNPVTVHTPVVMYPKASDDKEHDQRTTPPTRSTPPNPDVDRHAWILDRPFTVTMPTRGQHRNIPGYGNSDYAKYTQLKQVKFPFDVYTETKQGFYPKETWISVPVGTESPVFYMPVWVPEARYTVEFRAFAINANAPSTSYGTEKEANVTIPNPLFSVPPAGSQSAAHTAVDTIEVDVVGRLYDFRVTDILDFQWGPVFRTTEGLIEHTGNNYWVGNKMIDGNLRPTFKEPFRLPVRHGSHPKGYPNEMKNVAVKTGYSFKFDMKSKGNMWNSNDAVRITPTFYFVDKNGNNRRPVDVYYHSDTNYFVKIGSENDKEYREVTLNEPLRNVEKKQLSDTADFTYRHPDEYGYREIVDKTMKPTFIRNFERDYTKRPTSTGTYSWQVLNSKLRTLIGPDSNLVPTNAMVPTIDVKAREQQWFGEYSLPADIYVVDQGRDIAGYGVEHRLTKKSPIFLQDGFVIVNFNIETIDNGATNSPRLQYHKGPLANQWKMEGFNYSFNDPYGNRFNLIDGDVIFYHGDQSSYDDFGSNVTH